MTQILTDKDVRALGERLFGRHGEVSREGLHDDRWSFLDGSIQMWVDYGEDRVERLSVLLLGTFGPPARLPLTVKPDMAALEDWVLKSVIPGIERWQDSAYDAMRCKEIDFRRADKCLKAVREITRLRNDT